MLNKEKKNIKFKNIAFIIILSFITIAMSSINESLVIRATKVYASR